MSAYALFLGLLVGGAVAPVTLQLTPAKDTILIGEPLRLNLRWRAHRETAIPSRPDWGSTDGVQIWISAADKEREYIEAIRSVTERITVEGTLPAGKEDSWDLLLQQGFYEPGSGDVPQLAFPEQGSYGIQVRYGRAGWLAKSNWITIKTQEPTGDDRILIEELKGNLEALKYGDTQARQLLERYRHSPYLQIARVRSIEREAAGLRSSEGPSDLRSAQYRRLVNRLLAESPWGVYDDLRLGFLVQYARRAGDTATAERTAQQLKAQYPYSPATRSLREVPSQGPPQ